MILHYIVMYSIENISLFTKVAELIQKDSWRNVNVVFLPGTARLAGAHSRCTGRTRCRRGRSWPPRSPSRPSWPAPPPAPGTPPTQPIQ